MGQQYQARWKYFVEAVITFQVQLLQILLVFHADCGIIELIKRPFINCITGEFFLCQVWERNCPIWLCHFSFSPAFSIPESADLSISPTNLCFSAVPVFSPLARMETTLLLRVQSAKLVPEFSFSSSFYDYCAISILNEITSPFIDFFTFCFFLWPYVGETSLFSTMNR